MNIENLKPGDFIRVKFGYAGTQLAKVKVSAKKGKHGTYIKAEKLSANSGKWSKPRPVYHPEIICKLYGTPSKEGK
jgi:hypothetical protein